MPGTKTLRTVPFLKYTENNDLKTSGLNFNNDYAIYLDAERKFLLETGVKRLMEFYN